MAPTVRLTTAQALIRFLSVQFSVRDSQRQPFFAGVFGIFGHGNIAGIGQALDQMKDRLRYYQCRNEQAMVHTAAAFAKRSNRTRTFACTTSVGPGATNMVTGAAGATINRLPVLLLPGDVFANRVPAPVLQQLEAGHTQDVSVNDCFRPVSKYWDRIARPEQLVTALPEVMRVLTSPADTGAVTLSMPQDTSVNDCFRPVSKYWDRIARPEQLVTALPDVMRVLTSPADTGAVTLSMPQDTQTEAYDYPAALFQDRDWYIQRPRGDATALAHAATAIRASRRPLLIAGGGVLYSEAAEALRHFVEATGIAVCETQAGKSVMPWDHPSNLGAIGATGGQAANQFAAEADLVIAVGTRLGDFTTMSKTAFAHPDVRFVAINVCELDAFKHAAIPVIADARVALDELAARLSGYATPAGYREAVVARTQEWKAEVNRQIAPRGSAPFAQAEVIGAVNQSAHPDDVVVCAAGSLPGDLHKLWRSQRPNTYHAEYGYSCMGYEIAGGLGVKMAGPSQEVYVMVGDGSYLMMAQEIVTSVQEGLKLIIVLCDSQGYASIGALSRSLGSQGFGTQYRYRDRATGGISGEPLPVDLAANAESLGAHVHRVRDRASLDGALAAARAADRTTVIFVPVDPLQGVPGYLSWWDVPVAEVSAQDSVRDARRRWEEARKRERYFL